MISKHLSYEEATISPTALRLGIDNTPNAETLEKMKAVAISCFEPLREWYGKPIKINSFYRCPLLNSAVHGSPTSQHKSGEAIDMTGGSRVENKKIYDWCKANLKYDQLLWEYGNDSGPDWVHISFSTAVGRNRNETKRIR